MRPRLLQALPLLFVAALLTACGEPARRPNVVLIIIDTLRADMLSSYGCSFDSSPALTRLGERGVQFDSVIAQASWTLPSIGSMLTSRYPRSLGLYSENAQVLPDSAITLAEVLKRAGYATLGITANPNINSRYNFDQGFDRYEDSVVVFRESRDEVPDDKVFFLDAPLRTAPDITDSALEFARELDGSQPGFIQINVMEVHEYFNGKLRRPEYDDLFTDSASADYLRMVRQVTDDIERFVNELSAVPGWESTLFVITSDHGEGLDDHPEVESSRGHGMQLYASHVSVPWIMYNPTWTPKRPHVSQPVGLMDLAPTVLDYAGVEVPDSMNGASLMSMVDEGIMEHPMREFLVTETHFRGNHKVSAIGEFWQYIDNRTSHGGVPPIELQEWSDVQNGSATNRAAAHDDRVTHMREFIAEWEAQYEPAESVLFEVELSVEERELMESLGYLGGDEPDARD